MKMAKFADVKKSFKTVRKRPDCERLQKDERRKMKKKDE